MYSLLDLLLGMPHWSRKLHMLLCLSRWQRLLGPQFDKRDNHRGRCWGLRKSLTSLGRGSLYLAERTRYQDRTDLPAVTWPGLESCPNAAGINARSSRCPAISSYPRHRWPDQRKYPRQTRRLASPGLLSIPEQTKYRRFSNCHLHFKFCF